MTDIRTTETRVPAPTPDDVSASALAIDDHEYFFDSGSELGHDHLAQLARTFDPVTRRHVPPQIVGSGWRCLDLGAGAGTVAAWLADQVGPDGEVHATDLETGPMAWLDGVHVHRHDVTEGLPVDGPFDLIHARALLLHLPEREEVFARLVDALAPGGWLLLGEASYRPLEVVAAPSDDDAALWRKVQHLSHDIVAPAGGMSASWAHEVAPRMLRSGLTDVDAFEHAVIHTGGDAGCLLHRNLNEQAEPALLAVGATRDELRRYRELLENPAFRVWSYQFVSTRGRRTARA